MQRAKQICRGVRSASAAMVTQYAQPMRHNVIFRLSCSAKFLHIVPQTQNVLFFPTTCLKTSHCKNKASMIKHYQKRTKHPLLS